MLNIAVFIRCYAVSGPLLGTQRSDLKSLGRFIILGLELVSVQIFIKFEQLLGVVIGAEERRKKNHFWIFLIPYNF